MLSLGTRMACQYLNWYQLDHLVHQKCSVAQTYSFHLESIPNNLLQSAKQANHLFSLLHWVLKNYKKQLDNNRIYKHLLEMVQYLCLNRQNHLIRSLYWILQFHTMGSQLHFHWKPQEDCISQLLLVENNH